MASVGGVPKILEGLNFIRSSRITLTQVLEYPRDSPMSATYIDDLAQLSAAVLITIISGYLR